jgi:hypothetical protein
MRLCEQPARRDGSTKEIIMARDTADLAQEAQKSYFSYTDQVPEEVWYWAALGSIGLSAFFKLTGKDNWAIFVGQWPPTFLLLAIFHKVVRPR